MSDKRMLAMKLRNRKSVSGCRQRGVTLVELMIAMLLGLVLVAGIIQIFTGNRATYEFTDSPGTVKRAASGAR